MATVITHQWKARVARKTAPDWDDSAENGKWFAALYRTDQLSSTAAHQLSDVIATAAGIVDTAEALTTRGFVGSTETAENSDQADCDDINWGVVADQSGNSVGVVIFHNTASDGTGASGTNTTVGFITSGTNFPLTPDGVKTIGLQINAVGLFNYSGTT